MKRGSVDSDKLLCTVKKYSCFRVLVIQSPFEGSRLGHIRVSGS